MQEEHVYQNLQENTDSLSAVPTYVRGLFDMKCVLFIILKRTNDQINFTSLQSIIRGLIYITSVCESTSEMRHGRLIWVYL